MKTINTESYTRKSESRICFDKSGCRFKSAASKKNIGIKVPKSLPKPRGNNNELVIE